MLKKTETLWEIVCCFWTWQICVFVFFAGLIVFEVCFCVFDKVAKLFKNACSSPFCWLLGVAFSGLFGFGRFCCFCVSRFCFSFFRFCFVYFALFLVCCWIVFGIVIVSVLGVSLFGVLFLFVLVCLALFVLECFCRFGVSLVFLFVFLGVI